MTLKLIGSLLIFNIIINSLYADDDWVQKYPFTKPAARAFFSMSYISDNKVLLYGGYDADSSKYDYWIYNLDNNTWTEKTPSIPPPHIYGHSMSYIGDNKVLLFGGRIGSNYSDTTRIYYLESNSWEKQYPSTKPPGRMGHDMAYIGNGKILLYGGSCGSPDGYGKIDDTWIYDLGENSWNQISTSYKPSLRYHHRMCYIGEGKVLLFGGENFGTRYDDTWLFNLSDSTWTKKCSSGPSGRYGQDIEYIGGDQVLLFGGRNGGNKNDTWVYDLSANYWILDDNSNKPRATSFHQIARTSMDG